MDTEFSLHPESTVDWAAHAVCQGVTEVFFGPSAERPERRVEREALAASYCDSCPVVLPCRRNARLNREHGFWGGENDEQRAAAGYAPRSPSRRSVIAARDEAKIRLGFDPDTDGIPSTAAMSVTDLGVTAMSVTDVPIIGTDDMPVMDTNGLPVAFMAAAGY